MAPLIWLVTGCSSGFGYDLSLAILARGDKVIATARSAETRLNNLREAGAAILDLDITASQKELDTTIHQALKIYGTIDVLVNNAGYIEVGMLEELDNEQILKELRTNLLGQLGVTRSLLPHFRSKRAGKLMFMSSLGAHFGAPGASAYSASKGALESAVHCLKEEVSPFEIQCCIISAGFYRTKIYAPTNIKFEDSKNPVQEYTETKKATQEFLTKVDGAQPGDSRKGMECIVDVVKGEGKAAGKPFPYLLPLGSDAVEALRKYTATLLQACNDWEDLSKDTNY